MSTEIKEQVKQELLNQKEEELKKQKDINSKLKEITIYCIPNNPVCKSYIDFYTENGIKFNEKDIDTYPEIFSTTQQRVVPIILVNDEYLVHNREFQGASQSIGALRYYASSNYIKPSYDAYMKESLKNMRSQFGKQLQQLSRNIQPIIKVMSDLQKEMKTEIAPNKNKQPKPPASKK